MSASYPLAARPLALAACLWLAGCQSTPSTPLPQASYVDLERFMQDWYVIASIPTFLERDAHNAVESYRLAPDGSIETTFSFRKGGFDGPRKVYRPRGFVRDTTTNATWGMQFVWPIKADYRVLYLSEDYGKTIIGRQKRDYVWIMSNTPQIAAQDYQELVKRVAEAGYDTSLLRKVPQRW